jgi:hypothetical protein
MRIDQRMGLETIGGLTRTIDFTSKLRYTGFAAV